MRLRKTLEKIEIVTSSRNRIDNLHYEVKKKKNDEEGEEEGY
jgi:hypothetical protein